MKFAVLKWYFAVVILVAVGMGAFGMAGPWMVSQSDSLTVFLGVLVYVIGLPAVGFAAWKLVDVILDYNATTKEVS